MFNYNKDKITNDKMYKHEKLGGARCKKRRSTYIK